MKNGPPKKPPTKLVSVLRPSS
uniref:Uncharacterized protein n=1 Tax=Arundo donax TaxID=35708 RepID=A0A0A8Y9G7_ARUDO